MPTKEFDYAIGELESRYHDHMGTLARMRADPSCSEEEIEQERKKAESLGKAVNVLVAHSNT